MKQLFLWAIGSCLVSISYAQKKETVKLVQEKNQNTINVFVGSKLFTSFIFPDSLAKPVLYPIFSGNGAMLTRGYPMYPLAGDPTDHPHHVGLWLNFENVNGLDFWNNSFAIPKEKKGMYGSIKTDRIIKKEDGAKGVLAYHANWVNQKGD